MSESLADVLLRIVERRTDVLSGAGHAIGAEGVSRSALADRVEWPVLAQDTAGHAFLSGLLEQRGNAIIAEVKMGSPKLGDLRTEVDAEAQARIYGEGKAAALSVVVEPDHFFGSYQLLERCRRASGLPAIAKDFLVSEQQLRWARDAGAGAVLLIAALYESRELEDYALAALALGLVPLVETHTATDIAKLMSNNAVRYDLVGINNRDLRDFSVDIENSIRLRPTLPASALSVAESGIHKRSDIEHLSSAGFDAFLVGESLLLAKDPAARLSHLRGDLLGARP